MTFDEAIEMLREEYERAKELEYIQEVIGSIPTVSTMKKRLLSIDRRRFFSYYERSEYNITLRRRCKN